MGRKKQFINKKEAHRFHLVHRSQQDPQYHGENGSKLILTPADMRTAQALNSMGIDGVSGNPMAASYMAPDTVASAAAAAAATSVRDRRVRTKEVREVDEWGLPIDGYDYSKHLSSGGGGVFISKSGKTSSGRFGPGKAREPASDDVFDAMLAAVDEEEAEEEEIESNRQHTRTQTQANAKTRVQSGGLSLPDEVLASGTDQDRMLESITLREELMDEDIRRALEEAEEVDENGLNGDGVDMSAGLLDDDFMAQLAVENEKHAGSTDDFDFEAHMARLMAEAEAEDAGLRDDGDAFDDSDYEFDDGEDDDEDGHDGHVRGEADEHFEKVLEQYDDDQIGELYAVEEDEEDEELGGQVELDSDRMTEVLAMHMEAIRLEAESGKGILGSGPGPGPASKPATAAETGVTKDRESAKAAPQPEDDTTAERDGEGEDNDAEEVEEEEEEEEGGDAVRPWGEYANVSKPKVQWDCATILSTYTTTDNHPSRICVVSNSRDARRRRRNQAMEQEGSEMNSAAGDTVEGDSQGSADEGEENEAGDEEPVSSVKRVGKNEAREDKRLRKKAVKEARRLRRMEKKQTKTEFRQEYQRLVANSVVPKGELKGGITTFRLQ